MLSVLSRRSCTRLSSKSQLISTLNTIKENCKFTLFHSPPCLWPSQEKSDENFCRWRNGQGWNLWKNNLVPDKYFESYYSTRNFHSSNCLLVPNAQKKQEELDPFLHPKPKATLPPPPPMSEKELSKLGNWEKFKRMFRDYWYVLVPVHLISSAVWFGIFYTVAISGVDIVALLKMLGASEAIYGKFEGGSAGYVAIAYALYKVASPARYTVTFGGTTIAINYLVKWGLIEPAPSPAKFHQFLRVKGSLFFRRRRLRSHGKVTEKEKEKEKEKKRKTGKRKVSL